MSRPARKHPKRRTRPARPLWRLVRLIAICAFVGLAAVTVGFVIAESGQAHFGRHAQTTSACNATLITTGNQQPARWFSINSGSPTDILSAAKCTDLFQSATQGHDLIANALQAGTLANPVLVKPYRSDAGLSQFWVVPVLNANKYPLALLTFFYDAQSRLIHEAEFDAVTGDMFYVTHPFPAVTASMSVASVNTEQHSAMAQGEAPELIYFPGDLAGLEAGRNHWQAGGTAVIDPIWRVPGADGDWHYVDHNGHAHMSSEIPVDPTYQAMPMTTATH
jgi:hypothetical protein